MKLILKKETLPLNCELGGETDVKVLLDLSQDEGMKRKGVAREIVNRVQKLRKSSGLHLDDDVVIFIGFKEDSKIIRAAYESNRAFMEGILRKPFFLLPKKPEYLSVIARESFTHEGEDFEIVICHNHLSFVRESSTLR